jgi:hypothetical protein
MGQSYKKQQQLPLVTLWALQSASIDSTVSLLSGGDTSSTSYSPLTWFFNHETQAFCFWTKVCCKPEMTMALPSCVDKVTLAKIPMVTGGYNGGYMSSTELLMQWDLAIRYYSMPKNCRKFQQEKTSRCQIVRIKIGKKKSSPGTQYSSYDRLEVLIWTRFKIAFRKCLNFSNISTNMEDTAYLLQFFP